MADSTRGGKKEELVYRRLAKGEPADRYILSKAGEIVERADARGILLRLLGATAFFTHCPRRRDLFQTLGRKLTDIDLVTYGSFKSTEIERVLAEAGFQRQRHYLWHAAYREIYADDCGLLVDVFRDGISFSHELSLSGRLEHDRPTIPLPDLLLQKLQIHQITEKDMKDVAVLVLEHEVGAGGDRETIDLPYVARVLADDWGFCYDALSNLRKIGEEASGRGWFSGEDARRVGARLKAIVDGIEGEPKSGRWLRRAKRGTRRPWYAEVGEIQQGI